MILFFVLAALLFGIYQYNSNSEIGAQLRWTVQSIKDQVTSGRIDPQFQKFFDRDPDRVPPNEINIIVSPADGIVKTITTTPNSVTINIALSFYDVHVQRIPISGWIGSVESVGDQYYPGKDPNYLASVQTVTTLNSPVGQVIIRQITSLFTKRIQTDVHPGDTVTLGSRMGRILLGSMVSLTLPGSVKLSVKEGDRVYGAETIIARY